MKSWLSGAAVLVVGALLGSFLGKFLALALPEGNAQNLFATDISAGLSPARLDLRIVEITFGCLFRFNVMSVVGILAAAFLYKKIIR